MLALLTTMLWASIAWAQQEVEYTIPMGDIATRDPFVTVDRKAGLYYIITTARDNGSMALRAFESPDLKMWRERGLVYSGNEGWMKNVDGKKDHWWAPDTYFYRGRYYTIVTLTCGKEGRDRHGVHRKRSQGICRQFLRGRVQRGRNAVLL